MGERNTIRRLEKLRATFEQLMTSNRNMAEKLRKRDEPLVQKVKRLEEKNAALRRLAAARERVLVDFTKKYEDAEASSQ